MVESEETEVKKDKEWMKEELGKLRSASMIDIIDIWAYRNLWVMANQLYEQEVKELERKIKELDSYNDELIRDNNQFRNELDNQEVLSEEWLDEHLTYADVRGSTRAFIRVEDLQDLIVLKKEEIDRAFKEGYEKGKEYMVEKHHKSKPVIPQFVADWIETYIEYGYGLYPALKNMENNSKAWEKTYDWYRKNTYTFEIAYLTGKYEVEKEQKYYVLDAEDIPLLERANNHTCKTTTGLSIYEDGRDNSRFELTEQEIKDYDPRYMTFAKPIEELEK